jgi:hypothetical protein
MSQERSGPENLARTIPTKPIKEPGQNPRRGLGMVRLVNNQQVRRFLEQLFRQGKC